MWNIGWRDRVWDRLSEPFDLLIVGGGITGAGVLREATRAGLRALMVESGDFASGTSSRSSKLVHGGLRYLRDGKLRLTLVSVQEREHLLREGRGLVTPLGFLLANFKQDSVPSWVFGFGLILYDLMGLHWGHRHYSSEALRSLCPPLTDCGLEGGFRYFDAQTDDARLVLRVILESVADGGLALNYARAENLLLDRSGQVHGATIVDQSGVIGPRTAEVRAGVVINATGAWADGLRAGVGGRPRLRKLRGGHLVFPWKRMPLTRAVTFLHPTDGRPVFAFPWEGVTVFGTTDVDHDAPLEEQPSISPGEIDYLLEGLRRAFPDSSLEESDIQCTFAGVRGVLDTGKDDPSKESREHVLWDEQGLVTLTGGKLTTFRTMALGALNRVRRHLPADTRPLRKERVLDRPPAADSRMDCLSPTTQGRLLGRYGREAHAVLDCASEPTPELIGTLPALWAELRWAARSEGVVHLDDLLSRRLRLSLTLPGGGINEMERIRSLAQGELGWDDSRWEQEVRTYTGDWREHFAPPTASARDA
ncbi:MAG: glycerol-3-phosphate dehydrogenase/oxidase [Anaerolineales bacterium]